MCVPSHVRETLDLCPAFSVRGIAAVASGMRRTKGSSLSAEEDRTTFAVSGLGMPASSEDGGALLEELAKVLGRGAPEHDQLARRANAQGVRRRYRAGAWPGRRRTACGRGCYQGRARDPEIHGAGRAAASRTKRPGQSIAEAAYVAPSSRQYSGPPLGAVSWRLGRLLAKVEGAVDHVRCSHDLYRLASGFAKGARAAQNAQLRLGPDRG